MSGVSHHVSFGKGRGGNERYYKPIIARRGRDMLGAADCRPGGATAGDTTGSGPGLQLPEAAPSSMQPEAAESTSSGWRDDRSGRRTPRAGAAAAAAPVTVVVGVDLPSAGVGLRAVGATSTEEGDLEAWPTVAADRGNDADGALTGASAAGTATGSAAGAHAWPALAADERRCRRLPSPATLRPTLAPRAEGGTAVPPARGARPAGACRGTDPGPPPGSSPDRGKAWPAGAA